MLVFFDFLNLTGIVVQFASKFFIEMNYRRKAERRAFLKTGEINHYNISVLAYQRRYTELRRLVCNAVLAELKIPHDLWNRSAAFYANNSVFAPQLYSIVSNFLFKHMVIKYHNYNELKKDEEYEALLYVAE